MDNEENNSNIGENYNNGDTGYNEVFGTSSYSTESFKGNDEGSYNREVTSITKKENKNIFKSNGVLIVIFC